MKILVIGLDAATMDLVEPWAAAGHLPNLARLMKEGASARLLSTPNMHSASAWTSILTGVNPGRHGLFVFSDRDYTTDRQVFFKGGDRSSEGIWSMLARGGMTSGLLNVPMTYPAECSEGGFMVSGLDAPSLNERAFCPRELRAELLTRFPDYCFNPPGLGDLMAASRAEDAVELWMKLIRSQTSAAEWLIASRPVDFFMTVYTASDWGGHNFWEGAGTSSDNRGRVLLSIYSELDRAVERLMALANEQTRVFVISDHGMGAHTGASYHLADWLESAGYLARKQKSVASASLLKTGRRTARALLPTSIKQKLKTTLGDERVKRLQSIEKDSFYDSIDWQRTTAYTEPGRHVININLSGRNAAGIVEPADFEAVCDRLTQDLMNWHDASGRPVVSQVARRDQAYFGPFAKRASDLHISWNPEASFAEPPAEVRARGFWWSGDHRPDGILICKGPGIPTGAVIESPSVYDLAPTFMHSVGLPVPSGLDGRVIGGLFTHDIPQQAPSVADAQIEQRDAELSDAEEKMVEEKLRSLGYL